MSRSRFFANVTFPPERVEGCWIWNGGIDRDGYGRFGKSDVWPTSIAHRISYLAIKGDIEPGMTLDHLCRNRVCVNPNHLEQVTIAENVRRGTNHDLRSHCKRGHPLSGDNLYWRPRTERRECRTCRLVRQ